MSDDEIYELQGYIIAETDKAVLVVDDPLDPPGEDDEKLWLPKSQVEVVKCGRHPDTGDDKADIAIPLWLAEKKGLE